MKRTHLLYLIGIILTGYSCSKNENIVKPDTSPTIPIRLTASPHNATSYTPSSPISLTGESNITISGKSINGGSVPAIALYNCNNVHITQNSVGNSTDVGIYLYNCYNITVDYNYITNVATGVYVDHPSSGGIVVNNNQFLNMQGAEPRGQAVQFNTVNGAGNEIEYNECENISGKSSTQEAINCYMSNGTASSPIEIVGNQILGGGPGSASGGIQLGDTGGSYEVASDNILVNPGQMGLSISGGDHMSFINNKVYAASQSFTNVGIVIWGQAGYAVTNPTVSGNQIRFINASNAENDNWIASGNPTPAGWSSNTWGANINASMLPASIISPTAAKTPLQPASTTTTATTSTSGTASAPIVMTGKSNVTISNLTISGGSAACITLTNCTGVYITACNLQNSTNVAIILNNCSGVTIEKNNIFNVAAGIIANNRPNGGINVYTNLMENMQGPANEGAFVQYNNVGGAGNNISWNKFQNISGQSNPVVAVDIVSSNGTDASPITIDGNWLRGGGPNSSGGGIELGHNGGSYQIATNNILADPGQFGLAITGGNYISLTNNTVYGEKQSFTNVGIYVWGQGSIITNSTVSGNQVNFTNSSNVENSDWLASGTATPAGWSTNTWGADINESVLATTIVSL